jgi:enterochelin esterase family protein
MILLCSVPALAEPLVSPEVLRDGKVVFRLTAPDAKAVELHCEDVPNTNMERNAQGVWTLTSEPLPADLYAYSFTVDGAHTLDPANPLMKYNLLNPENLVHVPGPASLLWEINDVPHGQLHRHAYQSRLARDHRSYFVYTPPNYDPHAKVRYPTLYLLHGFSDDATAWPTAGRANVILDNLIARGQAKPMVVVMPLGYGAMDIVRTNFEWTEHVEQWQQSLDKFSDTLLGEVMPQVERTYRVAKDPGARAIAGLSMGGAESLLTGLNHPDRFAWVGSFSAGGLTNNVSRFPGLNSKLNDKLRLVWIACGKDDPRIAVSKEFCSWLASKDVHYTWVETPGAHTYQVWRRDLCQFAPLLFQDQK